MGLAALAIPALAGAAAGPVAAVAGAAIALPAYRRIMRGCSTTRNARACSTLCVVLARFIGFAPHA